LVWENRTCGQHALRWLKLQIEDGGEVRIESERSDFFADQPAMLAEELLRAGFGNFGHRWHWRDHIAQAIDGTALHVDAEEHRHRAGLLRLAKQCVCLSGIFNVALEENDPAGLKLRKHDAQALRHGSAVEAHDEQLANLAAKFEAAFRWHRKEECTARGIRIAPWEPEAATCAVSK
jgi:hypothetical protein